jgi:riboflavin kinase/FMN adenylyltransferase
LQVVAGSAALTRELVNAVVTIGNFDGLHVGHRTILEIVIARARARRGEAVVYTFDPHPRKALQPQRPLGLLTTLPQKLERLEATGIDVVVVEPFDEAFASISPERFVREILHGRLRPVEVYVGYDFRFGKEREGSMRLLTELGPHLGFSVTIVPEVRVEGRDVNSTRIRGLLAEGKVEDAAVLLDRPYGVWGRVVQGDRRGRTLGFPTANLELDNEVLPQAGVYAGHVRLLDEGSPAAGLRWPGVANLGRRPTFAGSGTDRLVCEVHLLDWSGDLYGRRVELAFERRLRAERRFPDAEALRAQIAADAAEARRVLGVAR